MADKPILFSAPMVRALLDGTKTQTRRILKPQPDDIMEGQIPKGLRISVGDRLWVKEAHYLTDDGHNRLAVYSEDQQSVYEHLAAIDSMQADLRLSDSWAKPHRKQRPMIFMPRWASRLTLIVTDVRVERLQDICEADAIAEGADITSEQTMTGLMVKVSAGTYLSPVAWYHWLWDKINGPGAWDANPWVVAYTFTVMRGNIDQIGGA